MAEQLVWAYGVTGDSVEFPPLPGVDPRHAVEFVSTGGLCALVSRVPKSEFSAEALRRNLNDLNWLAGIARAHEHVLEQALRCGTIVPLRLCTLYESEDGVRRLLEQEQRTLSTALGLLAGREEWGVKLLVDPEKLERAASRAIPTAGDTPQSDGGAYLQRRRVEREIREEARALAVAAASALRGELEDKVLGIVTRPAQNPELSGLSGQMLLNASVLVDAQDVGRLRALTARVAADHEHLGADVLLTGPWPPYNFVPGSDAAALA